VHSKREREKEWEGRGREGGKEGKGGRGKKLTIPVHVQSRSIRQVI